MTELIPALFAFWLTRAALEILVGLALIFIGITVKRLGTFFQTLGIPEQPLQQCSQMAFPLINNPKIPTN